MEHPGQFGIRQGIVSDRFDALGLNVESLKRMRSMQVNLRKFGYCFHTVDQVIRGHGRVFINESYKSNE